jgi:protein involved in polysaccharide export with SLBB domain
MQQQVQFGDRPAQYILGTNDVLLINVNLWGHVQKPGIYSIPSSFGIIDLLSSAGGPLKTARLKDVRIIRKDQEVIKVNIDEYLKTGNQDVLPSLQPGDVVIVSGSIADIFGRILGFVRDIAIIVNVYVIARYYGR